MLSSKHTNKVWVADYPELALILWDWGADCISEQDALRVYETRWPYVDERALTQKEKDFIDELINKHGNGVFLSA